MSFSVHQQLIFAARASNVALVEERLGLGGDPNFYDPEHGSAAAQAVKNNDVEVLSRLLEAGLRTENSPAADKGLLEHALRYQSTQAAGLLADHGFKLQPHSRSIRRERLQEMLAEARNNKPNKPLEATATSSQIESESSAPPPHL